MTSDLWVDILEAQSLDEVIGQKELVYAFKEYARTGHVPNMTISGKAGCGKTLLAKLLGVALGYIKYVDGKKIDLIPGQFYIFDASTTRKIDDVRTTIKRLSEKPVINGIVRVIVLDEFNYTQDAQFAMRSLMQECSDNTRFIILSNDTSNIIEPIISRCPIKVAQPLTIDDIKIFVERAKKYKEFNITPEAIELLYKLTQGDLREFIGKLQDACVISNFNVGINHIQSVSVDIQTAKAILEAAMNNYDQAREVLITVYAKVNSAKIILEKLYEATGLVNFANGMPDDEIIKRRIRERIAETDFRLTQGTNQLLQLDALLNYIRLIKFIPLQCPKAK